MIPTELGTEETLLKRFKQAKEKRMQWENLWRKAYQYAIPDRNVFEVRAKGQQNNAQVYDETAVKGVPKFATRVQAAIVPPWSQFVKLESGSDVDGSEAAEFEGYDGTTVDEILEEFTDIIFEAIHQSNFSSQAFEAFKDLAVTYGALMCNADALGNLVFKAVPINELYLEDGPNGVYETVWRHHEPQGRDLMRLYEDGKMTDALKAQIDAQPDKTIPIVEGTVYEPKTGNYHLVVIIEKEKQLFVHRDLGGSSPWIIFPWSRNPGEIYSRGPVIDVLPAILDLNKMWEYTLLGSAWRAMGIWTGVDDGMWNPHTVELTPGTIVPVGSNETSNPSIRPLEIGGDMPFTDWFINQKKQVIDKALFANPMGEIADAPVRTLGENQLRVQDMLEEAGASFSLLETEMVQRVIKRSLFLLQESGQLPKDDGNGRIDIDGKRVTLKMQSPIAQARDAQELGALDQFVVSSQNSMGEGSAVWLNPEETVKYIREQTGIPARLVRSQAQVDAFLESVQQAAQDSGALDGGV